MARGGLHHIPRATRLCAVISSTSDTLTREALERLLADDELDIDETEDAKEHEEQAIEERVSLNDQRLVAVASELEACGARSVIDLGCGEGRLLSRLLRAKQLTKIVGIDVSPRSLEIARERLHFDEMPERQRERIALFQASLTYRDARFAGVRRGLRDRSDRASRAVAPRRVRAHGVRIREAVDGDRHHSERRVQREVRIAAGRQDATPRSPVRVVACGVRAMVTRGRGAPRLRRAVRADRRSRRGARPADADGGLHPMKITIPETCLVVLVGASGSGKSSFARKHFAPTEVISSDACRGLVADDENALDATKDAFEVVHFLAHKRLARQKLVVIDATNVQPEARKPLVAIAREHDCLAAAIILDVPPKLCHERNESRADRQFGFHVVRQHSQQLRRSIQGLRREGFRYVTVLDSVEAIDEAVIERTRLWTNRRDDHGPFDIIGDVHGCFDELVDLLRTLGYQVDADVPTATPPAGRRAIFLGDLVDRGPGIAAVLKLVMSMVHAGTALCVPGNHETKLLKKLQGRDVKVSHGLAETLDQLARETPELSVQVGAFIDRLVSHYVLDDGKLVVAHAGMKESFQGRASGRVREFALYGESTGEVDEFGLPVRYDWAADYRGGGMVVYGHTPVPEAEWFNRTICIDTGCVFGGKLTALRYPEKELVQIAARRVYYEPVKPLRPEPAAATQRAYGDLLDIGDVQGKRVVTTRIHHTVTVREENAAAALEVMSRFAVDPRWLIYLPPTMSPPETRKEGEYLEHPAEAFAYFRKEGIDRVICEQKHMGSRAVFIVCRDEAAALERFGIGGSRGVIYTRTGRPFFQTR